MEFKDKLLELRKKHGMTQNEMAEALFVSRQTLYKWETGRVRPDIDRLKQICLLFHVSSDELLDISICHDINESAGISTNSGSSAEDTDSVENENRKIKHIIPVLSLAAVIILIGIMIVFSMRQPQEVKQASELGIVPEGMENGLTRTVTEREMLTLLSNVCEKETGSAAPAMAKAAESATNEQMTREKAAYWLYCTHIWTKLDPDIDLSAEEDTPIISQRNVYEDLNAISRTAVDGLEMPWERSLCRELAETDALFAQYDGTAETNVKINAVLYGPYYTSVTFCLAQRSFINEKQLMDCAGESFRPKDKITREEAIAAAYRLYGSW